MILRYTSAPHVPGLTIHASSAASLLMAVSSSRPATLAPLRLLVAQWFMTKAQQIALSCLLTGESQHCA